MLRWIRKVFFFLSAWPAILRAAWRLTRHRQERLDRLVEVMRQAAPFERAFLRHPGRLAASTDRLLGILPPFGYGRCYKRSLILLDLWSRCDLDPMLHLGVQRGVQRGVPKSASDLSISGRNEREFHAWITTGPNGPWTSDNGHEEIWRG